MKRALFCILLATVANAAKWIPATDIPDAIEPVLPEEASTQPLLNERHKQFKNLPAEERQRWFADSAKRFEMRKAGQWPKPVRFMWQPMEVGDVANEIATEWGPFTLEIAKDPAFNEIAERRDVYETCIDVYNLEVGTKYWWRVRRNDSPRGPICSKVRSFYTEDCPPRILRVDCVANFRDLGGYQTCFGKRVKQGLIFRCGGFNDNCFYPDGNTNKVITGRSRLVPAGLDFCLNKLKIRSDIDLRWDDETFGMTGSPLGPTVQWLHIPFYAYHRLDSDVGREGFQKAFRVFLDTANYPVAFHCISGQDRTGTLAFILDGLLGVADEDLKRDWEFSGFTNPALRFNHEERFLKIYEVIGKYSGATLLEKIESFVLSNGFTRDDIARFRSIMLE